MQPQSFFEIDFLHPMHDGPLLHCTRPHVPALIPFSSTPIQHLPVPSYAASLCPHTAKIKGLSLVYFFNSSFYFLTQDARPRP